MIKYIFILIIIESLIKKIYMLKCSKWIKIDKKDTNAYEFSIKNNISLQSLVRINNWKYSANPPFYIPKKIKKACIDINPKHIKKDKKGYFKGLGTWYDIDKGITYCNSKHNNNESVVALSKWWFNNNKSGIDNLCGEKINLKYKKIVTEATVVDQCCICDTNNIDMTPSLFNKFKNKDIGIFNNLEWEFKDYNGKPYYNNKYNCSL